MSLRDKLDNLDDLYDEIENDIAKKKRAIKQRMADLEDQEMFGTFESEMVKQFLEKPYVILPRGTKKQEWLMIIPKFFDFNVGWLLQSTDSYNVFIVNKYADYLGAVPKEFQGLFKFKPRMPLKVLDGVMLTGEDHQDAAWERYKRFLSAKKGSDAIRIKKGKAFDLIAALIDDGILPFMRKPVAKEHRVKAEWNLDDMTIGVRQNLLKRTEMRFFKDAINKFYKTGAVGVYWATGVGKTLIGLEVLSSVRVDDRPNVVISGTSAALKLQWEQRLSSVKLAAETIVVPFQSWHKIKDLDVGVMVIDECLPHDTMITTEHGDMRIGDIVASEELDIRAWSYNFDYQRLELKPVTMRFTKTAKSLIEIESENGNVFKLTPTHKVFMNTGQHLPAKDLKEGMKIVRLRHMRENVQEISVVECSQDASQAPRTQQTNSARTSLEQGISREVEPVQGEIIRRENKRVKSELERGGTQANLCSDSLSGSRVTKDMHGMPREIRGNPIGYSPRRREHIEQHERKPDDSVPQLSRESTQGGRQYDIEVDYIRRVRTIEIKPTTVYDLEILDNHNFFANGILVSNCHHLPANSFSKIATMNCEYRMGLSATPYREDGRSDYIFALTGFPIGLDWKVLIDLGLIIEPEITLYLSANYAQKRKKLAELLRDPVKTLIYCFSVKEGKSLSREFSIPFVYGDTPVKERLQIVKNSHQTIVSSAMGEGISVRGIQRTMTYNFLFGSRQEETQFFGRLLHGAEKGKHVILMTDDEYERYGKRLYGIQEKGFKIAVIRVGGSVRASRQKPAPRPRPRPQARIDTPFPVSHFRSEKVEPKVTVNKSHQYPLLDERDEFGREMVLKILRSDFAKREGGLSIGQIREVLEHHQVKYGSYSKLKNSIATFYNHKDRRISRRKDGSKRRYFITEG